MVELDEGLMELDEVRPMTTGFGSAVQALIFRRGGAEGSAADLFIVSGDVLDFILDVFR
ncbi:hypothetical protein OROMI_006144 [Orobanche minor]